MLMEAPALRGWELIIQVLATDLIWSYKKEEIGTKTFA